MALWLRNLLRFKRNEEGIAFVEFAICMPFLLALLMGAIEVTRFMLIEEKTEKVVATISDVVAQGTTVSSSDLANIITAAGELMRPYTFNGNGYVIISSVVQTGAQTNSNPPTVSWQYIAGSGQSPASKIGIPGGTASMPANFTMADKDNVIVTEVYYNYTPIVAGNGVMNNQQIYKNAYYKPRFGTLSTLQSWLLDGGAYAVD